MGVVALHAERKVPRELAEQEFERFAEAMDLDLEKSRMDADDLKAFESAKGIVLRAMERGQLVIDEKGQPVFTPSTGGDPLTFYEPTGGNFMSMDGKKKDHNVAKMVVLLAEMTRTPEKTFSKFPNRDFKVCSTLVTLFLG